jgi:hypothetical protein
MTKTVTRLMAAAAALGLVAAPIVAQANTRAASGPIFASANAAPGMGRAADGEGQEEGGIGGVALGAIAGGVILVGVLVATDVIGDDDDDASPGT